MAVGMEIQDGSSAPLGTCFIQMVSLISNKSLSDSPLWRTEGPVVIWERDGCQLLVFELGKQLGRFSKHNLIWG